MKNQIQRSLLGGIRDLHIKILQANDLPEIGNYLQEILDKVIPIPAACREMVQSREPEKLTKSRIIRMMKSDIESIVDGTYNRIEIAKYQATVNISRLKRLFAYPSF